MELPGHTDDSIAYVVEDAVFVGDSLFHPAYGTARCDFPGGDAASLYDSIKRLHALADETRLFLCHDYPGKGQQPRHTMTVKESRDNNVHVGGNVTKRAFIEMRENRDAGLSLPKLILPSLQVNIRAGGLPATEDNGVSYLKIPFNIDIAALVNGKNT